MKRGLALVAVFLLTGGILLTIPHGAVSAVAFNQNDIMDDVVFDDSTSMTEAQIQSFLSSFPNSCLTNYSAPYPTDYFNYGSNVPASTVIKRAADLWHINPKVILTTLEKEESLVTGNIGCADWQYNSAVGMGCPDGGTCPAPAYAGFSKQVTKGMWQLKFSKERAYGNLAWNGDGDVWYYGYMTTGSRARQNGQPTTYYDGYATIDNTSVYMSNGATAALYTYTPHFHGNQNFQTIFNLWFGSTQFPQPIGALIEQSQSTGTIYLVDSSTATPTRYTIPDWQTMQNYGLDAYPAMGVNNTTLQAMTDGGILTSLIWDGSSVYFVNNQTRYPVTLAVCANWGFSCSDSTKVNSLPMNFQTQYLKQGPLLPSLSSYAGVTYSMSGGMKEPIANQKSLSDLGLSNITPIAVSSINSKQQLGPLLMTTPGIVKFSPNDTIYYFNGTNYYSVSSMNIYYSLSLNTLPSLSIPTSSYNTSAPLSTPMTYWTVDTSGNHYVVNSGRKILLSIEQQKYWPNTTYTPGLDSLLSIMPNDKLNPFIKSGVDYYILSQATGDKHYITSMADYTDLGGSGSNTTYLDSSIADSIPTGLFAFPDGSLLKVGADPAIYVMNAGQLLHIPSMSVLYAYNFNASRLIVYPQAVQYPKGPMINYGQFPDGTVALTSNNRLFTLSPSQATAYGLKQTSVFSQISQQFAGNATKNQMSYLLRNSDNGNLYYASNGSLHYIGSIEAYKSLGGGVTPLTPVDTQIIDLFNIGADV